MGQLYLMFGFACVWYCLSGLGLMFMVLTDLITNLYMKNMQNIKVNEPSMRGTGENNNQLFAIHSCQ